MSEPRRAWKAYINWSSQGAHVFCVFGYLSECGEWVVRDDRGEVRWKLSPDWHATEAEARKSKAPEIAAMGARLLEQAEALTAGAEVVT